MDKLYDATSAEKAAQALWEQYKTYHRSNNPGPLYSIDTPPPTVSGALHIGHIFSYTQTDIIARYKRMMGFSVFYPFGFDDNGLPTERFVEKKHNIIAHNLSRSEFIALCLKETHEVEKQFEDLWKRMGLSADWSAIYSTISESTRKISQESFIRLFNKGYVYRKSEPALYCTTCRTSVSQAELDDKEVASTFNDIVFKDEQGNDLMVGTTRPELLPSCVALLYNPHDTRYTHLKGTQAQVPVYNFKVPIIADELVAIDKGTGLVMCCTFGDKTDIIWYKKHKLPFKQSIGLDGKWVESTGILAGLRVVNARERILQELKTLGLLKSQKPIIHSVNVHERCKKEIEYIILTQWFLDILSHKKAFLDAADTINWYPTFMKSRYQNWVENVSWDWCLSRQRFFGIPFPAWHCTNCNEIILAEIKDLPIDPQETPYKGTCPKCKGSNIVPDSDVMDTWNTSSLTPYLCQYLFDPASPLFEKKSSFMPMSMRPQAHDIIRTWAFDTIIKAWMHHETIPWNDIVISGHVLSDAKEKLSKSKENASLTPEHLLNTYSADVIRFWTASGSLGHDVPFSENQLKIGQRLVTKLWNAFRFIDEHIADAAHEPTIAPDDSTNQWLLHRAHETYQACHAQLEQHEFGLALQHVEQFFWKDFCDNYLELIKDQLFNPSLYNAQHVAATKATLSHVGLRLLQLYAPYLPYITETLYQQMYQKKISVPSLHQTKFSIMQRPYTFETSVQVMHHINDIVAMVRKLKTEQQLSLKADLAQLIIYSTNADIFASLRSQEQMLKGVTRARTITYQASTESSSLTTQGTDLIAGVQVQ